MSDQNPEIPLDVVVVGAGYCGLIFLKCAAERGLRCRLLEKETGAGGIWRRLPPWQDIQTPAADWSLGNTPIEGTDQKSILKNIQSLVSQYNLAPLITYGAKVENPRFDDGAWTIGVAGETIRARYLVLATGLHNDPVTPEIRKTNVQLIEYHSSQFPNPKLLQGQRVAIVGGGASAFDLLELCFQETASEIHWIYRGVQWMIPSSHRKDERSGLRKLALAQMRLSNEEVNALTRKHLTARYAHFGLQEIQPAQPFDYAIDTAVPGRPEMIRRFKEIRRYPGQIVRIEGKCVVTTKGEFEADLLLYGTGYRLNLDFLGFPGYQDILNQNELAQRCGSMVLDLNHPNVFFFGPTVLDTNSSIPFYASTLAKTIVAHISGRTSIPRDIQKTRVPHWKLLHFLARFDRSNYPRGLWRLWHGVRAWWYAKHPSKPFSN